MSGFEWFIIGVPVGILLERSLGVLAAQKRHPAFRRDLVAEEKELLAEIEKKIAELRSLE